MSFYFKKVSAAASNSMDSRSFLIEMSTDETLLYRISVKNVTLVSIFHLNIHVRRWMESSTFPITVIEERLRDALKRFPH